MKTTRYMTRTALLLGSVAATALMSAPVVAQDNGTSTDEDVITVTARRREETLQDVPMSVTAFGGEQLETAGAVDIVSIGESTPNVTLEVSRGTNSTLTAFIVEGDIQGAIRRNRMQKRIDHLSGHYIVCGVGSTGIHCVEELINTHTSFVVIDRDEERLLTLADKFGHQHFLYVVGDATEDEILISAGLDRAVGVISTLTDDKDNLYVTVTAYQLERKRAEAGEFRIVSKSIDPTARGKLLAAGATRVVSPSEIGGMRMVSEMVRPAVVEFLDLMLRDPEKNLRIEEVSIPDESPLIGVRLRDTAIRARTKVLVIAVKHGGDEPRYTYNPGPDLEIEHGMILIVLAETVEMNKLRDGIFDGSIGRL